MIEGKNKYVQKFAEWENDTFVPDEHFWATLQRIPSVPLSVPVNSVFDVLDMIALVQWWSFQQETYKEPPTTTAQGHDENFVYESGDLLWLLKQHLFAKKFDPEVDIAIRCTESILHFRALGHDPLPTQEYSDLFNT